MITKIRAVHGVQINFPKKGDPEERIITITGYEQNAYAAKDEIMKIVNEWVRFYVFIKCIHWIVFHLRYFLLIVLY